jgi:ATP-dependent DNA ligase
MNDVIYKSKCLVVSETGEIISTDVKPRFNKCRYDDYTNAFPVIRYLEPQTCLEADKKHIPEDDTIAEQKFDGTRETMYVTSEGNRFFSRRISKKTIWFAENTDCVPHLRDLKLKGLEGCIFDGELTTPTIDGTSKDVQSIIGSLPETALENQIESGFAVFHVFDILYYKGVRVENLPLYERKKILHDLFKYDIPSVTFLVRTKTYATKKTAAKYPQIVDEVVGSFKKLLYDMWDKGLEGLVVKYLKSLYEQKRTKTWLKLKPIKYRDVVILGYNPATIWYDGKSLGEKGFWDYWADAEDETAIVKKRMTSVEAEKKGLLPVTKPWAMDWIGSINVGVYKDKKLIKVAEVKGISDKDLEYIKKNEKELIGEVIEIKFNQFIDKKKTSCRHPRFSRWRDDKNAKDCTWNAWINEEDD